MLDQGDVPRPSPPLINSPGVHVTRVEFCLTDQTVKLTHQKGVWQWECTRCKMTAWVFIKFGGKDDGRQERANSKSADLRENFGLDDWE